MRVNRYEQVMVRLFEIHHKAGDTEFVFERDEIDQITTDLGIGAIRNLGDLLYTYRYRADLPQALRDLAPVGTEWRIRGVGSGRYKFIALTPTPIAPNPLLAETKVPNATPGVITLYRLNDEQALLAMLRYNRLIDIFTGLTCYSLQNHLRSNVPLIGQVETDELYIGLDRRGAHFVLPVQAKGRRDRQSIVQIEQDIALCATKYPSLTCLPVAAQFMDDDLIALFLFEVQADGPALSVEKHYRLVPPDDLTRDELKQYESRPSY